MKYIFLVFSFLSSQKIKIKNPFVGVPGIENIQRSEDNFLKSFLSFHQVGPGFQAIKLGGKHPYMLNCLAGLPIFL